MTTAKLMEILKQLNANGYKVCIFSLKDGLPIASQNTDGKFNEKMVSAMGAMLSEASERVKEDLGLADLEYFKTIYGDACIVCQNIKTSTGKVYLLIGLTDKPENDEVDKYNEKLFDWAIENALPVLEDLSKL
jgi:predicted regulator of Ras-like GTPase activity (Roadblock/LC7/MglB family)